ncbi:hypothetical protein [Peribacillus kribbensis]|uniref:hypothetical protein n=1 Tax=Peribacillus kribbensis TaxID=356658 RepID=UPI000402B257|nr:hypothetical protein [Peribacillus kribbensis]
MLKPSRMKSLSTALLLIMVLSGCSNEESGPQSKKALFSKVNPKPALIAPVSMENRKELERIKQDVMSVNTNYDAAIARKGKEVLVSYKVKHFKRFQMKKIESQVTKKLEKDFPSYTFTVSSDYKIFLEIVRLSEKTNRPGTSTKEAAKRFNQIVKLKEELT